MSHNDSLLNLRNIGISAHVDAGKTTLTEHLLYYAGDTHRLGDVDEGNTVTDFDPEEQKRGITINSAAVRFKWKRWFINLIDTPGHVDFTMEVERSLRVLDGAVIVLCGEGGVETQTKTVWRQADRYNVPRLIFVNKLDKRGSSFQKVMQQVEAELTIKPAVVQLPYGQGESFCGVIDVIERKLYRWDDQEGFGRAFVEESVPADLVEAVEKARTELVEKLADLDDEVVELYLSGAEITSEMIKDKLRKATLALKLVPVLCGAAARDKGVQPLLDAVVDYLPSPLDVKAVVGKSVNGKEQLTRACSDKEPLTALAFKVVDDEHGDLVFVRVYAGVLESGSYVYNPRLKHNERVARLVRLHGNKRLPVESLAAGDIGAVLGLKETTTGDTLCMKERAIVLETITCPAAVISRAIEAESRADQQRLAQELDKMRRADPSFRVFTDRETGQTIIAGLGELHLEVKQARLKALNLVTRVGEPQVSYRESIRARVRHELTFKRQTGGHGMYAQVVLEVEPIDGDGFEFEDAIVGGAIPGEFIGSVEKGIRNSLNDGCLAGYPVVGVKVTLVDGKAHDVDSSDMAFQIAGSMCFKEACAKARPVLLEPWMSMDVFAPASYMGDILADVSRLRGRIVGSDVENDRAVIRVEIPLRSTFGYSSTLRSRTSGEGEFGLEFLRYEAVPPELAEPVIKGRQS